MRGARQRQYNTSFDESQPDEDILSFYKSTEQTKADARFHQKSPEEFGKLYPQLAALYKKESHDGLSILAPLRPTFRGLERMTFNVGYACMAGFAAGMGVGLARVLPHSWKSYQMGESLWVILKRTARVTREEGAHGLRRWGSIVTLHSLIEATARYMLWNAHHKDDVAPEPVMMSDDMSPQQAMQLSIKEPARRSMANYDIENMNWSAKPGNYSLLHATLHPQWPPEDPRVLPVWTALPIVAARVAFSLKSPNRGAIFLSSLAYPVAVFFWQSRMPPDTYMDLNEEFVPDESMM